MFPALGKLPKITKSLGPSVAIVFPLSKEKSFSFNRLDATGKFFQIERFCWKVSVAKPLNRSTFRKAYFKWVTLLQIISHEIVSNEINTRNCFNLHIWTWKGMIKLKGPSFKDVLQSSSLD